MIPFTALLDTEIFPNDTCTISELLFWKPLITLNNRIHEKRCVNEYTLPRRGWYLSIFLDISDDLLLHRYPILLLSSLKNSKL